MDCERVRDLLSDFLDGSLEDSLRSVIASHLQECGSCTAELTGMKETLSLLRTLPLRKAPPELLESIHQKTGRESSRTLWVRRLFLPAHIKIPLQAAAAILLFFLVYGTRKEEPQKKNPPLPAPQAETRSASSAVKSSAPPANARVAAARSPEPKEGGREGAPKAPQAPASLPTVPARRASTEGGRIEPPPPGIQRPFLQGRDVVLEVAAEDRPGLEEKIAATTARLGGRVIGEPARQGASVKIAAATDTLRVHLPSSSSDIFLLELSKMGALPPEGLFEPNDLPEGPPPDVVAYTVRIRVR